MSAGCCLISHYILAVVLCYVGYWPNRGLHYHELFLHNIHGISDVQWMYLYITTRISEISMCLSPITVYNLKLFVWNYFLIFLINPFNTMNQSPYWVSALHLLNNYNFRIIKTNYWPMYYDGFEAGPAHNTLLAAANICYEPALLRINHNTWLFVIPILQHSLCNTFYGIRIRDNKF